MNTAPRIGFRSLMAVAAAALLVCGCPRQRPAEPPPAPAALPPLEVVVAGNGPLARSIEQLAGEWRLQTGGALSVRAVDRVEKSLPGDVVIGSVESVAVWAEAGQAQPLDRSSLESGAARWGDLFEMSQVHEARWGEKTVAVPIGLATLSCYCRADLLQKLDRRPPTTWTEYADLAKRLSDAKTLGVAAEGWSAVAEPTADGWAGLLLLARAAAYAKHPENYSALFDIESLKPLIATPPFVRALSEMAEAVGSAPRRTPAEVRAAFWQGKCALAITWPSAAQAIAEVAPQAKLTIVELPGSREVYHQVRKAWEPRPADGDKHIPLVSLAGWLGVIPAQAPHRQAAEQLLGWLSSSAEPALATQLPDATLVRRSQQTRPGLWTEKPVPLAVAAEYTGMTRLAMTRQQYLSALRMPGRAEYLAALDRAVASVLANKSDAGAALRQAATEWEAITERLGRARQRSAYLRDLGLEP